MRNRFGCYALRTFAVVLGAVAIYRFAVLPWRANHILSVVENRTSLIAGTASVDGALTARGKVEKLNKIASVVRTDPNYYMLHAFNERVLRDDEGAIRTYSDALRYADHRPEIYFGRGEAYFESGNIEAAAADLTHAARFNPGVLDDISGELRDRVARAAGIH